MIKKYRWLWLPFVWGAATMCIILLVYQGFEALLANRDDHERGVSEGLMIMFFLQWSSNLYEKLYRVKKDKTDGA